MESDNFSIGQMSVSSLFIMHEIVFENKYVRNKPAISKDGPKDKFTEKSTKETVEWFSHPKNFIEIKEEFTFLIKVMRLGSRFSIGF